jgi:predicted ATPase
MKSIRLQNIRCLQDTGFVELKPLTIIVGENSSGKSTFARMFPLFKQSVMEKPQGPLLFYGEFVDFGSIKNFRTRNSETKEVIISFIFDTRINELLRLGSPKSIITEIGVSIGEDKSNIPSVSAVETKFHSYVVNFKINNYNEIVVTTNDTDFQKQFSSIIVLDDGELIPDFLEKSESSNLLSGTSYKQLGQPERYSAKLSIPKALLLEAETIVRKYNRSTVKGDRINLQLAHLSNLVLDNNNFIEGLPGIPSATAHWRLKTSNLSSLAVQDFLRLEKILSIHAALRILNSVRTQHRQISRNVRYIAPIRATAERYYRTRNISVSEVDFRGENLAMYISSLYTYQLVDLKQWLVSNFKMELDVKKDEGHISLHLKHVDSQYHFNIADMGFGFSQIVPILVQLWSITNNRNMKYKDLPLIYVVEQPELHLHPRMQSVIAEIFCNAVRIATENQLDLRIIIETHSESIINKVGRIISDGKIKSDTVNIVIFDKNRNDTHSTVRISTFKDNGQLENWPWGFFD